MGCVVAFFAHEEFFLALFCEAEACDGIFMFGAVVDVLHVCVCFLIVCK
jgi:hypothetical protein